MATVMRSLDLMITADSMPAHLAGALGVPVWTLLHAEPDWRWMEGRLDSPWYPTMRLFRQPRPGEWGAVIAEVREALLEELASPEEADQPSRPATRRASSS
jgi:ADP-heptose:LPS heptosyltransferase